MDDILYVVTCVSNPQRYKSRYRLYEEFKTYISQFSNVVLYTVELAFADRDFVVTDPYNPCDVQIRGDQEFWHKENLLNIGISRLPADAKYIAWVDADVQFLNPHWAEETMEQLQHYDFVQMFSEYVNLGPDHQVLNSATGFVAAHLNAPWVRDTRYAGGLKGTTGLAWAARREALNKIGGLIDWCITGSGDWHMAYCFQGRGVEISQGWLSGGYRTLLQKFQDNCDKYIHKNVGFVKGTAVHYWHGPKSKRGYGWRWKILKDNNFDPILDLKKDVQGLYIVNPEKHQMLHELREYFKSRKEDSDSLD